MGISVVGTRTFLQGKAVLGQGELLPLVSWTMLMLTLHESEQLHSHQFHGSHSHLLQVWLFPVSLPQRSQECAVLPCRCHSHCYPEFPIYHWLCLPLPPTVFTSPACLPAALCQEHPEVLLPGSDTHPGDRILPQCHLL